MDTSKLKTLEQVSDAMDALEDQRAVKGLSQKESAALDQAAVALRNVQRTIIKQTQDALVTQLTQDAKALSAITAQIEKVSKKLDKLTDILEKTSTAINGLINVVTAAIGAGLA